MKLKTFQREDYARLATVPGGILAHDPGLGKTWAAFVWSILKTGFTEESGTIIALKPALIVAPGDLHAQFEREAWDHFRIRITRLDSQARFLALSHIDPASGRRTLPPGFYITSYTQLGSNGVPDWKPEEDPGIAAVLPPTPGSAGVSPATTPQEQQAARARLLRLKEMATSVGTYGHQHEVEGYAGTIRCIAHPSLSDLCMECFHAAAVDEGTKIKGGFTTEIGTGVMQLNPPHRLVLTATPIKNRVPDLFSLDWWACGGTLAAQARFPYALGDRQTFAETFCVSERNLSAEAKARAEGKKANRRFQKLTPQVCNVHKMWKLQAPIILRRRKKDIGMDIVPKHRHLVRVPMGTAQAAITKRLLKWQPKDKNGMPAMGVQLQALRMAAAAPWGWGGAEVAPESAGVSPAFTGKVEQEIAEQAEGAEDGGRRTDDSVPSSLSASSAPSCSEFVASSLHIPKMHTCLTIIEQVLQRNEQVIVFSPFHAPLDGLEQLLREAGVRALKLDGRTSQKRRADLAALFKAGSGPDGWPVLLAGQECMAEGHSFHLCNNVIQYSYPWALDKVIQAEDRAHRLNSVKPLNAYRLICNGSIDRKMESQIDEKSDAAEMVLDGHLLGEQKQEMNMAELLEVAAREIALVGDTVHEMTLAAQWPELRARLKAAGKGEDGRRKTEDSKLQRPESPLATRHSPPAPAPFNWRTAFVRRPVLVAAGC